MLNISNDELVTDQYLENQHLKTFDVLPSPEDGRWLSGLLLVLLVLGIITLFLPWRQNISGDGTLTALTPADRPQTIQNAIAGRIEAWRVQEGQRVSQGDTLLIISEIKDEYFDPNLTERLDEQLDAKNQSLQAGSMKIDALDTQLDALLAGLQVKLASARNKVQQGRLKVRSDSTDLIAARNNYQIALNRLERYEQGHREGLFSLTDLEARRLKVQEDQAKLVAQENKLGVSRNELANARLELSNIQAEYMEKKAKALSDRNSAVIYQADTRSERSKIQNKISSVQVRQGMYAIRAPQAGYVVRALKAGVGETIKEGEAIATLQPANPRLAVELFVRAMDVPLISRGRTVRLQFDGWPAIQFSGWPSVAVGTFGGEVSVIDAVPGTDGRYRLLVSPRAAPGDQPWPEQLRLGSGVLGWVMLDDVPIWYELWRQLNGFPASLKEEPKEDVKK